MIKQIVVIHDKDGGYELNRLELPLKHTYRDARITILDGYELKNGQLYKNGSKVILIHNHI